LITERGVQSTAISKTLVIFNEQTEGEKRGKECKVNVASKRETKQGESVKTKKLGR